MKEYQDLLSQVDGSSSGDAKEDMSYTTKDVQEFVKESDAAIVIMMKELEDNHHNITHVSGDSNLVFHMLLLLIENVGSNIGLDFEQTTKFLVEGYKSVNK